MRMNLWWLAFIGSAAGVAAARWALPDVATLGAFLLLVPVAIRFKAARRSLVAAIVSGLFFFYYYDMRVLFCPPDLPDLPVQKLSGTVSEIASHEKYTSFFLNTDSNNAYLQRIQVYTSFAPDITDGYQVTITSRLLRPGGARNPGEFDFAAYLADQSVFYRASLQRPDQLQILAPGFPGLWARCRSEIKADLQTCLPLREALLMQAMLLGEKDSLETDLYEQFQKIGLVHWFAVSGLHVGFILLLCSGLSVLLRLGSNGRLCLSLIVMFLYAALIGWPISVRRAVIMGTLAMVAWYTGRRQELTNSLGMAGVLILLINPADLFRISFQLSFVATWGIIALFPALKAYFHVTSKLGEIVLVPLCAEISVLPLTLYYFNVFSLVSLLSNVLLTYILAAVLLLGFCGLLGSFFLGMVGGWFWWAAGALLEAVLKISDFFHNLPGAWWWVGTPSPIWIMVFYAGLLYIYLSLRAAWPLKRISAGVAVLLLWMLAVSLPAGFFANGQLEITFIDVGQGDAILLKSPEGYFMLVDGGGSHTYNVGERILFPYLVHQGVRRLDWVINTHPDTDHLQGIETVAAKIPRIEHIAVPAELANETAYAKLREAAQRRSLLMTPLQGGDRFYLGEEVLVQVLPLPGSAKAADYNEASLVLLVSYRDFSLLLTGDVGEARLQSLAGNPSLAGLTVVKVPHHGSAYSWSEKFYRYACPRLAVIQAGRNNPFNHPAESVLVGLRQIPTLIFRTDISGAVFIATDGKSLTAESFLGGSD